MLNLKYSKREERKGKKKRTETIQPEARRVGPCYDILARSEYDPA